MGECFVSFHTANDIREFVTIATRQRFAVRVETDQMQSSGESIMGLSRMGLNRVLRVLFPADADVSSFLQAIQPFLIL